MKLLSTHSNWTRHVANLLLAVVIAVSLPNILEYVIYQTTSFEFNVNHTSRIYADVCQGDDVVIAHLIREVRPVDGVPASSITELVRFQGDVPFETGFKASSTYVYQVENDVVNLEVDLPDDLPIGQYGFIEQVTIYPFWGIEKSKTFLAEEAKFNVIVCET